MAVPRTRDYFEKTLARKKHSLEFAKKEFAFMSKQAPPCAKSLRVAFKRMHGYDMSDIPSKDLMSDPDYIQATTQFTNAKSERERWISANCREELLMIDLFQKEYTEFASFYKTILTERPASANIDYTTFDAPARPKRVKITFS